MKAEQGKYSEFYGEERLQKIGEHALAVAGRKGVSAEAFLLYERELSLEVSRGAVQNLKQAEQAGLGVRIIKQGRVGFAYTSDLSLSAVQEAVDHALVISGYTSPDDFNTIPQGKFSYPLLETYDPAIAAAALEQKIDLARRAEESARGCDQRITLVERSAYDDNDFACVVMNSKGVCASARGNFCGLHIHTVAEQNGEAQNGFAMVNSRKFSELRIEQMGKEAASRAVRALGARPIGSAHLPCLMEPVVTARFMSVLAQMIDAGAVQKNKSMFAGKTGQMVASSVLNLVDDGLSAAGMPFPFDGEGVPVSRKTIIDQGILKSFLYDTYTANRAGIQSTGNAQRASFRSLPTVGTTNFMILPGTSDPAALLQDMEEGLYITDVMGMHTANPISGDFSVGAAGIMVKKGRLAFPVRGITIAGNLGQMLHDIEAVGNDQRFFGSRGAPTLRLKSLSIGGE